MSAWVANGTKWPAVNRNAPIGGPASWLMVMTPVITREFATARSSRWTSIGTSVLVLLSAKTSAVPSRNIATRTTAIGAESTAIATASRARTTIRAASTATMIRRRSSRSVSAPAHRPNSMGGAHWSSAARATRNAWSVLEATSSGPAARAMPSPRLLVHDDAMTSRNPRPRRGGARTSSRRLTKTAG